MMKRMIMRLEVANIEPARVLRNSFPINLSSQGALQASEEIIY